ncbi:hypothetical protein QWJ34_18885 [Saccharibacillus sp. CPCC 101409]|uniref:hypothetical protein n=1 Tax=Saccharibacillus sp. CPCC 101409 TaxID=3058041 RepID=UPI002672CD65|nr:hypothetical protein [Saccharibacillus sp. CPCC 101409]MDO3411835.1 hypothetical protein [Saccharibacillus sp. CPCC 101409]
MDRLNKGKRMIGKGTAQLSDRKRKLRAAPLLLGGALTMALLGGCGGEETVRVKSGSGAETAAESSPASGASDASGGQSAAVTVKDNPNESVYSGLKLEKIDELDETLGDTWLDDSRIVIRKPDPDAEKVWIGETQMQPYSLYIRDLSTGEDELLYGGDGRNWGVPLLSPDGKHLFMINDNGMSGAAYIMEMDSRERTRVESGGENVSSLDAGWLDNEHVVYAKEGDGGLYQTDLSGQETKLTQASQDEIVMAGSMKAASDGRIYYGLSNTEWGMFVYDKQQDRNSEVGSPITSLAPSPDDTQLAVVKIVGDTKEELLLTEPGGKEIKTLAEGKGFFGSGWSPDGKRLAYIVTSNGNSGKNGFYIADADTGESFLLSPDLADAGGEMKWNPSGTKIMVTKSEWVTGKLEAKTTIVTVSW